MSWYINGTRKYADDSTMDYNITNTQIDGNNMHRNLTFTLLARADNDKNYNNTHVLCLATGVYSGSDDIETYDLIIASVPLPPQLMVYVLSIATGLNITWIKPFSPEGFPIISYNLTAYNQSSVSSLLISPLHADDRTYILTNPTSYSNTCHSLYINITARNAVGDSAASATIISGFPKVPDMADITLQEEVLFDVYGNARILVEIQLPEICTYQDAVYYTLHLSDEAGQVVSTIGPKPSTGSESIMEEFVDGIHRNKAYLVRLLVYYRELGEEAVINITRRSIVPACSCTDKSLSLSRIDAIEEAFQDARSNIYVAMVVGATCNCIPGDNATSVSSSMQCQQYQLQSSLDTVNTTLISRGECDMEGFNSEGYPPVHVCPALCNTVTQNLTLEGPATQDDLPVINVTHDGRCENVCPFNRNDEVYHDHPCYYTVRAVKIFKSTFSEGSEFGVSGPDVLTTCGDEGRLLQIGVQYLVGIGGAYCNPINEWSEFSSFSSEEMELIEKLPRVVAGGTTVSSRIALLLLLPLFSAFYA